ncbi:hypothetical protein OHA02_52455 [Streptomyces phaeochromogenes]|nr:hypothetical protein [Streptomyces phaeochromogenes]
MSTKTGGECWKDKRLPSVFKHALLKRYLPQFGGMTGSHSHDTYRSIHPTSTPTEPTSPRKNSRT